MEEYTTQSRIDPRYSVGHIISDGRSEVYSREGRHKKRERIISNKKTSVISTEAAEDQAFVALERRPLPTSNSNNRAESLWGNPQQIQEPQPGSLTSAENGAPAKEEPPVRRKGVSRREVLGGSIAAAATVLSIGAVELGPKIPQAIEQVLESGKDNLEQQLEKKFQQGLVAGANEVREEFLNALEGFEGVSLQEAINAAELTRVAYDVFISPLVTLASKVAGDFLTVTLDVLKTARSWLQSIYQDNDTLEALQIVLQSWVDDVNKMPKEVQTITDTDLDGAQAYLRSLQRKVQQEQALLNKAKPASTSTPSPKPRKTVGNN